MKSEAENKEREGLSNPASLAIFMRWWRWGGAEHGLTLDDCVNQPEWLLHDFEYIHSELQKAKRRRPKKKKGSKNKQAEPQALEDLPPGIRDMVFAKINEEKQRDQLSASE